MSNIHVKQLLSYLQPQKRINPPKREHPSNFAFAREGRAPDLREVLQVPLQLRPDPHLRQAGCLRHPGDPDQLKTLNGHRRASGDFLLQLLVKKAFFALVYNGVRAAPLWDSVKQR